jgi:hypothetical protein
MSKVSIDHTVQICQRSNICRTEYRVNVPNNVARLTQAFFQEKEYPQHGMMPMVSRVGGIVGTWEMHKRN